MTIIQASRQIVEKYLVTLEELFITKKKKHTRARILQLISMTQTIIRNTSPYDTGDNLMTEDKVSRWVGFIQGIMTVYGWIDVESERNNTRPIFHQAYEDLELRKPKSITAELDDIIFHIVDMQEFNTMCVEKYDEVSYKSLSIKNNSILGFGL